MLKWPIENKGPGFVNSIDLTNQQSVPRVGEHVSVNYFLNRAEQALHSGIVKSVQWVYTECNTTAIVVLE